MNHLYDFSTGKESVIARGGAWSKIWGDRVLYQTPVDPTMDKLIIYDLSLEKEIFTIEHAGGASIWGGMVVYERGSDIYLSTIQPVPEPPTMLLLGAGLVWLAGLRRRFRGH